MDTDGKCNYSGTYGTGSEMSIRGIKYQGKYKQMKYLLETPVRATSLGVHHKTAIQWRNGILIADEPEKLGGGDTGPDPYTLLLSSLVSCTLATLRMYIEHKGLSVSDIAIEANLYQKIVNQETITYIERKIAFTDSPALEIRERLMQIAENCPVSKILKGNINIITELKG